MHTDGVYPGYVFPQHTSVDFTGLKLVGVG